MTRTDPQEASCQNTESSHLFWYVVRAATRREKHAAEGLAEAGFDVYLPLLKRWTRVGSGPRTKIQQALFPGYLFVGLTTSQTLYGVEQIDGVHAIVRFSGEREPKPVNHAIIMAISREEVLGKFDKTNSKRNDPQRGATVEIIGGRFQGFPAQFVERHSDDRIKVLFKMLGRWSPLTLREQDVAGLSEVDEDAA